jgi:hypothetical protein
VRTYEGDVGWCETFELNLAWDPAFINVDSALAAAGALNESGPASQQCSDFSYDNWQVSQWSDYFSNSSNALHWTISDSVATKVLSWIRAHQ